MTTNAKQDERISALEARVFAQDELIATLHDTVGKLLTRIAKTEERIDSVETDIRNTNDALDAFDARLGECEKLASNGTSPEVILLRRDLDDLRRRHLQSIGDHEGVVRLENGEERKAQLAEMNSFLEMAKLGAKHEIMSDFDLKAALNALPVSGKAHTITVLDEATNLPASAYEASTKIDDNDAAAIMADVYHDMGDTVAADEEADEDKGE